MRKPLNPLLFGTVLGLLIGGSLRYVDHTQDASSTPPPSSSDRVQPALADEVIASVQANPPPRPTLEEVLQLSGSSDAETLARYLGDASIEEVIALMEIIWKGGTELDDLLWMVEMRGIELDPDAMRIAASELTNEFAFGSLLSTWVKMNPLSALQANLREHSQLILRKMYGIFEIDLDQVFATIKEGEPNTSTLEEFEDLRLEHLANKDPRAALTELISFSDGEDRRMKLSRVLRKWIKTHPMSAIEWMENHKEVPILGDSDEMMATAVVNLSKDDPKLARIKLEALPHGEHRIEAEHSVIYKLAAQDRAAALKWVRELPNSDHRDALVESLVGSMAKTEPEVA